MDFDSIIKKHTVSANTSKFSEIAKKHGINYELDNDYISNYVNEANTLFSSVQKDYDSLNYGNSSSVSEKNVLAANEIIRKSNFIRGYLSLNKNSLTEENYNQLLELADSGYKKASTVRDAFKNAKDYYSQWTSEDEYKVAYNDSVKLRELYNMSSDEIAPHLENPELSALVKKRNELHRKIVFYNRGDRSKFSSAEDKKKAEKRVRELNDRINKLRDSSSIAYTTASGQNITWQRLYDQKVQEENFASLYSEVSSAKDWKEGIDYALNLTNPTYQEAEGWIQIGNWNPFGEKIQNKLTYAKENEDMINFARFNGSNVGDLYLYLRMNDKEAELYNYYRYSGGEGKAEEFFNSIKDSLKKRDENLQLEGIQRVAEEAPVFASVASVFTSLASGLEYVGDAVKFVGTGELDENLLAKATNVARQTVSERIDWEVGDWDVFDFLYGTGMSMADSAVSTALFGKFGGIALGLSAAAQATNAALDRGMSKGAAFTSGLAAGIFEGIFESWSIGAFKNLTKELKKGDFINIAKYIGKNMWNNAKEETLTEIANITYDIMMNGEFSEAETTIRQLMARGVSESEAKKQVAMQLANQIVESGVSGALMGLGFSGLGVAYNKISQNKKYSGFDSESIQSLVNEGLESPIGSDSRILAEKLQNKINNGQKILGREIAALVSKNESQILSDDTAKINNAVRSRLAELGETGNIDAVSKAITKQVSGEQLTKSEQRVITESRYGQRVLNEATAKNIESGEYSSAWAESIGTDRINSGAYNLDTQDIDSTENNGYNSSDTVSDGPKTDITEEQREQYTAAILQYKSSKSYKINAMLRENKPLIEADQKFVNTLDAALLTLPTYEGTVYRQLVFDDFGGQEAFNDFLAQHIPGEPIYYGQYTSCSTTEDGYTVEGKYKIQLIIDGKSAHDVNEYGNNMENEVIFSRNAVFIVKTVEKVGEYTKIYIQEDIDNGYNTTQEQGDAVLHVQESHFRDSELQGVSEKDTVRNTFRKIRPQPSASAGQWDTIRAQSGQNALLSTKRSEQVKEADSNESASLMPKNSDLQLTAGGKISKLSAANPEYNPIEDLHYQSVGVERLTADQKKLKKVGQQFGAKVLFKDLDEMRIDPETGKEFLFSPEGQFDPETNTITLNTNVKEHHRPVEYILKHELTHSLEIDKDNYALFAVQVLRSDAFAEYVASKGFESADAWATEIIKQYSGKGVKSYQGPKAQLLANQEMVANFVGDMLFGGRTDITEKLLNNMAPAERSGFIAKIKEFFAKLKELFKGSEELTEIERLENLFLETANKVAAKNKTATQGSGDIVYSENGVPIIDLSNDNELSNEIGELTGAAKYKVIRDYILKTLDNQPIILSDGKKAIVDKSDALHIANRSGVEKTTQISQIKKLIQNAILFAESTEVEHNEFDYFCYYKAEVRYQGEMFDLYLNVGKAKNGKEYHLYDITKKIRDTAHRVNDVGRPVGNALENGVSINSIPENGDTVNNNYAQSDKQYSFAVERNPALIEKAEKEEAKLRKNNKTDKEIREVIWKELGIIRDTEGIWKYEINDRLRKKSQTYPYGTALIKDDPDFEEFVALIKKSNPTKKQKDRIAEISSKFKSKYDYGQLLLKHFLKHDELFAKYPQLKNVKIGFEDLGVPYEASYNSAENKIVFDKRFRELDDTSRAIVAMHEIQHAIQKIDDTEPGSSLEYWNARILKGERLPINPDTGKPYTAYEAYKRTKGEIEAREAGGRVDMTKNERRDFVPELGWENSISSRQRELVTALDSEYSSAVENGNLSKAQEMVDEVAQMFGYTERLYHQTSADFTEFNTNNQRAGKYDWELPTGAFLKPTDDDIGLSGKKQMELYANIRNPLEFKSRYAAQKYWSENIPGYTKAVEEVLNIDADYRAKVDAATDAIQQYSKQWRQKHPNENRRAIYSDAEYQRLSDKQADIIDAWEQESNKASLEAKRLIDDYIANNDYDGIIVERDKDGDNKETKSYIVFDSSQLKSAAPVTYDNSGNVVSLSERFDENQSDIRYSLPETNNSVENYTEEQYNNFGWVRYNDVLTPAEYSTLLSRYADYKHNKDKYPTTRFGEAVMHSTECPNVIMYVKGNIGNPHITKIVEIIADDNEDISVINERIIKNEYKQKPLPYQTITSMYGEEYLRFHRGKDYASFRQYRAEQEGINSQGGNSFGAGKQDRAGSSTESEAINIDRANGLKYSISPTVDIDSVIDAVEKGEMSASEAKELLVRKTLNPTEIANLPKEMADLTLIHGEPKRVGTGDEESKFYESALNSKIITDEVKQEIENDTYIKNYHSTTNKKTLRMAMRELEEGGYTRANEFLNLKAEKGSAVDVAVGLILLERYQRANRIDDALLVAEKLREIGTAAGQTVQMFSILGRFTPEMMVEYSARELKKAYEEMVKTKSQAWIDKNKTKFELTEEDIVFIKNNILFASNLEESRQKAILLAEVCARVQNKIPPESGQSIRALQRISLLLNPKTNIRNILGNTNMVGVYIASDFFGNLIDKQISKKTGIRTTGSYHLKGSGAAIKKGLYESYDDFKRGIRTKQDELNRYDVNHGGGKSFNENHKGVLAEQLNLVAKALNTLDNFTSFCLEAGDRPFFEMWFVNSLNNQMWLNNVDVPTPAMMEIARLEAEQRTWQDNNTVSRSMSQLKRTLNKGHLPGSSYGFGDFVLKFVKTPANIAKAMVEFSPIGLATAGSKAVNFKNALSRGEFDAAMQKEVVRSMSSAITGTLLYVLVAAGVALGAIELSGGGDDDKDVSNFEKYVVGIPPYSMKVFGQNITYSWNQPVGVILATVADFMESKEDGITAPWYEDLLGAIKTGTAVFTEQSFLSSLYELFSADDLATGIFDSALSEPSAFIPQFVSQIASFTDPYRRTTYHKGNAWRSAINEIIYKIPVLRKTLPEQVNILGETSKNTQYLNPWEAFISPGNTYPESSGKVAEEIYELYKLTGNNSVMPRTAPYSYTAKGENVSLTPKERNEFQRFIGTESIRILDALFDSKDYQSLNDEQKCKVIKKVYDYAYDKAKSQREYTYQTVANMTGGEKVLPKAKWDKLNKNSRLALVEDYFLTNEQLSCKGDAKKLAALFIRKSKE